MVPLFRLTEAEAAPDEATRELVETVLAHVQEVVGAEAMASGYTAARAAVTAKRQARKREKNIENLIDPEQAARRKLRRAEKNKAAKKRKMEEIKRQRTLGVYKKNRRA